ncbi:hypothetical protein SELMODRAFT_427716 [Selaginella moellendorffii]|uniref:Uncharacterized protein n=1 Tax=Selaginella moellendorffii TaxID=88036 RepID=D8T0H6_SELML|nr:hypothetical protein SELMODRAFT_427716 [Selaginella moellendorffii]
MGWALLARIVVKRATASSNTSSGSSNGAYQLIRRCSSAALVATAHKLPPPPPPLPSDELAAREARSDKIIVSGYDAWWREWQEQRPHFPSLGVPDILASDDTVVMDANIGAIFSRMRLDKASPDRQVFLGMLRALEDRGRLNAPPKLIHRYAIACNRMHKVCVPGAFLDEGDRNSIGHLAEEVMQWIVEARYQLPRDPAKSMDFLVTLLQCAFLYKSTILLTNNKDYYFVLKAAKVLQESMHASYPEYADRIDLGSIRIVFVQEQLKLNVHQVVRV